MSNEPLDQRFQMMMTATELEAIEQYRAKNGLRSTAEAIRRLCKAALEAEAPRPIPRYPVKLVTVSSPDEKPSTAQHLRSLRYQADLSQTELAELTGFSQSAISNWEKGGSIPRHGDYRRIIAVCEERIATP